MYFLLFAVHFSPKRLAMDNLIIFGSSSSKKKRKKTSPYNGLIYICGSLCTCPPPPPPYIFTHGICPLLAICDRLWEKGAFGAENKNVVFNLF